MSHAKWVIQIGKFKRITLWVTKKGCVPQVGLRPTDRRNHVVQAGVVLLTIINNGNKLPVIPMVRRFRDAHLSSPNVLGRRRRRKMLSPNIPSQLQRFH